MPSFFTKILGIVMVVGLVVCLSRPVLAGGGPYQLLTPTHGDWVPGTSAVFEVRVFDYVDGKQGYAVGEKFKFVAHQDLNGANCVTTQDTVDNNGIIRATCSANTTGRFVVHVESLTRTSFGNSPGYEVYFTNNAPRTSPSPTTSTDTVKQSPYPVAAKPTPTPSPLAEASPSPSIAPTDATVSAFPQPSVPSEPLEEQASTPEEGSSRGLIVLAGILGISVAVLTPLAIWFGPKLWQQWRERVSRDTELSVGETPDSEKLN